MVDIKNTIALIEGSMKESTQRPSDWNIVYRMSFHFIFYVVRLGEFYTLYDAIRIFYFFRIFVKSSCVQANKCELRLSK